MESLPELFSRRLGELNIPNLKAAYDKLPDPDGETRVSYETIRKLAIGRQRGTRDVRVLRAVALMLEISEREVREAMGVPPSYGPFELPARARELDPAERTIILNMVDALLRARHRPDTLSDNDSSAAGDPPDPDATPYHQRSATKGRGPGRRPM